MEFSVRVPPRETVTSEQLEKRWVTLISNEVNVSDPFARVNRLPDVRVLNVVGVAEIQNGAIVTWE